MRIRPDLPLVLAFATSSLNAADIVKADNNDELHLGSSWVGGVAVGPGDVAVFDATGTTRNSRGVMTADLDWGGIHVTADSLWGCRFSAPFATYLQLSLGSGGIQCYASDSDSKSVVITTDVVCTGDQTWTGTAGLNSIFFGGTARTGGSYFDLGGHTVTITDIDVAFSGNNPADYTISNGTFILNNANLDIRSGNRPNFTSPYPILTVGSDVTIVVNTGSSLSPFDTVLKESLMDWQANVILNGGALFASDFRGFFAGSASSQQNEVGGTILVQAPSSIELSPEISFNQEDQETTNTIKASITGNSSLSIKNNSQVLGDAVIVLAGDNSGFMGSVGINGDSGRRLVRLSSDQAGSATSGWNIASNNVLEIENSSVEFGGIIGGGKIQAMGGGSSMVTVSSGNFNGQITQLGDSTLHYRKVGGATQTLVGAPAWNGDTLVEGGTLSVSAATLADDSRVRISSGAKLRLNHSDTDVVGRLFLDGVEQTAGLYGPIDSGVENETSHLTRSGLLQVTGSTPYLLWLDAFPELDSPSLRDPTADPDGDGQSNLYEFALAGDPSNRTNSGRTTFVEATPSSPFQLILAMRTGTDFPASGSGLVSDPIDGLSYEVEASEDLSDFDLIEVMENPAYTPAPELGPLPAGWAYRAFQLSGDPSTHPKLFLRIQVRPSS